MAPKRPSSPNAGTNGTSGKAATTSDRERVSRTDGELDERGEFEDAWEDEYELEEVQSNTDETEGDDDYVEGLNGDEATGMENGVHGEEGSACKEAHQ